MSITAERMSRIERIFQSALDLALELREDFLVTTCANDPELRAEVEALLTAHAQAGDVIEDSPADLAAALLGAASTQLTQLGQYRLGELLGSGGMGEVYLATDKMGREVALKVLAPRLVRDPQSVSRFMQEARALLVLNHPNIVTVHDIGEADGTYYIVSELIEGETLRRVLKTRHIGLDALLDVAIQVATALVAAHEKGVVHRDVKPENVMIRGDAWVKVLDFGIAKLAESADRLAHSGHTLTTAEGFVIGTATYMSPEQARGGRVDARSDIWSFGVLLYEMLAGERPFGGESAADVVAAILTREPAPLARFLKDAPPELQGIVDRALMKEPSARYQTIGRMLQDLKAFRQEIEFRAGLERHNGGAGAAVAPRHARIRARWVVPAAVLTVAILLVVASAVIKRSWFVAGDSGTERLAVLDFEVDGDAALQSFARGLSNQAVAVLSTSGLRAVSNAGGADFRGAGPRDAAARSGATFVLDGAVREESAELLVNMQLIDAKTNETLWTGEFRRAAAERAPLQEQVATRLASVLRCALVSRRPDPGEIDARTLTLLLQACDKAQRVDREPEEMVAATRQLTERLPGSAEGWSMRAMASALAASGSVSVERAEALRAQAREAAERARELDPANAESDLAFALTLPARDRHGRRALFQSALQKEPESAEANLFLGMFLAEVGRIQEALGYAKRAVALEPLSPAHSSFLLSLLTATHDRAGARELNDRLQRIWPHSLAAWYSRFDDAVFNGRPETALAMLDTVDSAPVAMDEATRAAWRQLLIALQSGDRVAQRAVLANIVGLAQRGQFDINRAFAIASMIGEVDTAKQLLMSPAYELAPISTLRPVASGYGFSVFTAAAAPFRRDRRFMLMMFSRVLIMYWRETGQWPDFCSGPDLPYDCWAEARRIGFGTGSVAAAYALEEQDDAEEEEARRQSIARASIRPQTKDMARLAELRRDSAARLQATGLVMVDIPAGSFTMGSLKGEDNERPVHRVRVESFRLGATEVTVAQFRAFVAATNYLTDIERHPERGCWAMDWEDSGMPLDRRTWANWRKPNKYQPNEDDHPVGCLSWSDTQAYLDWLRQQTGRRFRLPTEAEWEYAARAGSTTERFWGDRPNEACAYANGIDQSLYESRGWPHGGHECRDGYLYVAPVASFRANDFGLYDMLGNVFEHVEDCHHWHYIGAPADGSAWTSDDCRLHVTRGGAWYNQPQIARSAARGGVSRGPGLVMEAYGFRLAEDIP